MDYFVKAYKDWKLHSQFQEIVPDMDDEYMFNEKQSIRESARSLKKYGSTCCNHIRNNETLIKHEIQKTDTLQGIALKYGCSTEQIRRANRLFASDSLFLREYLLVPVEKTSPFYPTTIIDENNSVDSSEATTPTTTTPTSPPPSSVDTTRTTTMSTSASAAEIGSTAHTATTSSSSPRPSSNLPTRPYSIAGDLLVQTHEDENVLSNHNNNNNGCNNTSSSSSNSNNNKQSKSLDSVVVTMTPEEENRKYINEFLSKIDTTISESRKYVEKSKEMIATTQTDDDVFVTTDIVQRKRNNHLNNSYKTDKQNHQNHVRQSSTGSTSDTAQLLNTTQTRRVQNSLKRLEKQQDEFFEL